MAASTPRKWSQREIMRLLDLYEKHEVLWNPTNLYHRWSAVRDGALKRICEDMRMPGLSLVEVKLKLKALRSTYNQELIKVKDSLRRGGPPFRPQLVWYDKADSFLRSVIVERPGPHARIQAEAARGAQRRDVWDADVEDSFLGPQEPLLLGHIKEEPPDVPSTSASPPPPPLRFSRPSPREHQQQQWPRRQVPQQMPGASGGPGGGGGGTGGGGQQSAKQSTGQQMAMLKKQVGQPGTMQQHGANKATGPPRRVVSPPPSQSPQVAPPEVCLRWNSYHSNMQATFPSLLTNEQFVDVTLACEGRSIKCHKVILSACSAYFEGLLSENPCQHPIVLMKDLRYWEVQALVDFMYRGEVNVGQDKLPSLLAAAEALQIKGLAGPASTPSSQDEDSMPATIEDFLDEQVPSPITERRMRKRRMMSSPQQPIRTQHMQPQQQQQQQHHQHHQQQQQQQHQQLQQQQHHQPRHQQVQSHPQPHPQPQPHRQISLSASSSSMGQSSMGRVARQQQQQLPTRNPPNSIPSTSGYRHEQPVSEAAPPRKQRRSEPLPEVKIEPIDIDLSNDSMDEEFVEKKFTPPTDTEAKDDGGGAEPVNETVTEQKPDIETENFSATTLSNIQELQDYPFEPGSNSCGTKSENIAEATSDSPFGSSPGGDDVSSHDAQGED